MRDGVPPDEARRLARLELGGIEQVREQVRTYRHGGWLDEIGRDVRYAFRMFVRNPGFTFIVVVTLALGIGANTAIFSLIDALMLRWLPVRNPHELVQVAFQPPSPKDSPGTGFSYAIVRAFADQREIFAGAAGFSGFTFDVGSRESVRRVPGALVTGGYYETLGLQPAAGRLLAREDDEPGAPLVAVISDGYWEREYARSAGAVGQTVQLNGLPVTIVGVSPRGFTGANVGSIADITIAVAALPQVNASAAPLLGPGNFWLRILARPQPGVSVSQAAARLNAVWPGMSGAVIAAHWPASRRKAMAESVFQLLPGGTGWSYLQGHLPQAAARADGRRWVSASHRLRKRRQPAAGARVGAAERDGRASGHRCRPGPNRASTPDREHAAVAHRGGVRHRAGRHRRAFSRQPDFERRRPGSSSI